jgi:hypothetical protein
MSDNQVEMMEQEDQNIEEAKKASLGDPSEIPEPTSKEITPPGGGDQEAEKKDAKVKSPTAVPRTKVAMLNAMMDKAKGMKKDELSSAYKKMMNASYNEETEVEEDDSVTSIKEIRKISSEDISVQEDVESIFGGEDLSEDFVSKATTVFEAAVVSKVNEILESVTIDLEAELESEKEEVVESLTAKLDDYLEYVAEQWMKENELAVEQGIRAEIVENFMVGMRNLFAENYIDIPEEKVDLVDSLVEKVSELEESANQEIDRNIELRKELVETQKKLILRDVCEDMTESQVVKIESLAEGVDFESESDYQEKLETIKETYFPEEVISEDTSFDDQGPIELEEETQETIDPGMKAYAEAISRSIKK